MLVRKVHVALLSGASLFAMASFAGAQAQSSSNTVIAPAAKPAQATTADAGVEEVVVTARRRAENVQTVPLVVDAVTNQELQKYHIINMADITSVVPGLALKPNANGIGAVSTLRGVNYDVNASGNNGTIQFYLNDQPVAGNVVIQSMYDVGQIEVLRGPQGTLRGRAAPSGSITVTTKLPDLEDFGGYADATVNNLGGHNVSGAVNIPIIEDKLAIRIAGLYDYNEGNRVTSINDPGFKPYERTGSERVTVRFDPTDDIDIVGTVQNFRLAGHQFAQVESANIADPTQPASPVEIGSFARKSVQNTPNSNEFNFLDYNLRATWHFFGQKLDYVGASTHESWDSFGVADEGDYFDSSFPGPATYAPNDPFTQKFNTTPSVKNFGQFTQNDSKVTTNEVRLASEDPLWGVVDYTVGALFDHEGDPVHLWEETPIYLGAPTAPALPFLFEMSNVNQVAHTTEDSVFANVNVHIDDATELSAGGRYISFKAHAALSIASGGPGFPPAGSTPLGTPNDQDYHPFIYSASLKHTFNDNIMAYVSTGTSWRANAETNGIIDRNDEYPWGVVNGLMHLGPEKSTSYEAGIKTDWFDKTVLADLTVYHQDFTNYFYSSPNVVVASREGGPFGPGTPPTSLTGPGIGDTYAEGVFGPAASVDVPVKVNGAEATFGYQPLPNWSINAEASYSLGKIQNGVIPCNSPASILYQENLITAQQFIAANGGQQVATCNVNSRAGLSAPFSAQIQSEYTHKIFSGRFDGFARGLLQINGDSQNDPLNPIDDVSAYTLLNLYAGLRDPDGMWELTVYGKNILDTQRVLSRSENPDATSIQILATGVTGPTTYRPISVTPQPEFGINLHIALGGG